MKSFVELLEHLLLECGRKCAVKTSRDVETLRRRCEHEGDGFITISLPAFCQSFERGLEEGRLASNAFPSFGKMRAGIPKFLQGFLCQVFTQEGCLLAEPSINCIRAIRQFCLFGKKVLRPCSDARQEDAVDEFAKCDDELAVDAPTGSQLYRYFGIVARHVCERLDLGHFDLQVEVVPRHGPGATQEGISGNQKWIFRRWHMRLEEEGFTFLMFGRGVQPLLDDHDVWPKLVEPRDEEPSRVVLVPKTAKAPRVIAVEPVCMQYAQQGLARVLCGRIEKSALTVGHVNFRDQSVNQDLAFLSSSNGKLATLDMKEASDRVTLWHVREMFKTAPGFLRAIEAARSTRSRLPNGDVIPLKKFASMGSALCFPVEALVFYTSIIASRCYRAGKFPTPREIHRQSRSVFVYGDDLIVPAGEAAAICDDLETLQFRVNRRKSFWTGKFRESCGVDCYGGREVTPVYLRRDIPTDRCDASGLVSTVSTANQLDKAGYVETAAVLKGAVEAILGRLPKVSENSPALGWWQHSEVSPPRRWNRALQRPEWRCWVQVPVKVEDPLDGNPALAKCFQRIGAATLPSTGLVRPTGGADFASVLRTWHGLRSDDEHLETSSRPYGLALKRRWVPAPA